MILVLKLANASLVSLAVDLGMAICRAVGCLATGSLRALLALVFGTQEPVPESKEWLGEVGLDAPSLVVNVVVRSVVVGD